MLLIGGELITDISKELLRITSRPKIIPIKNPKRRRISLIKYHIQGPANPLNQKPVSSGEVPKSSDTALRPSATNIIFLPNLAHKMLSLYSDRKQFTSFSHTPLRTGEYNELWNQKFEDAIESNPVLITLAAKCSKSRLKYRKYSFLKI